VNLKINVYFPSLFLDKISGLLPEEKQVSLNALPQQEPSEIFNSPKWDLCTNFHEDLGFKFTLVCRSIISSIAGKKAYRIALTNYSLQVSML
jgi:hypothetical protein